MVKISRSVAHRLDRRRRPYRYWMEPIISPYVDRLMHAAVGDHVCQYTEVTSYADLARGERVYLDEHGTQHTGSVDPDIWVTTENINRAK